MSIFTSASRTSKATNGSSRRRSNSTSRAGASTERKRVAALDLNPDLDVATMICVEVSRAIILNPKVDTGIIFKTSSNSRSDLRMSDTTIVCSAAILEHIGNNKMSKAILEKSKTCSTFFSKLGLENKEVREMFVTILFAVNPEFIKLIEAAVRISLDRAAELTNVDNTINRVSNALVTLNNDNTIEADEVRTSMAIGTKTITDLTPKYRLRSSSNSDTETITKDDSVSNINYNMLKRTNRPIRADSSDLINFAKRKNSGTEPDFYDVFKTAKKPVSASGKYDRTGVGHKAESITTAIRTRPTESESVRNINNLLPKINTKANIAIHKKVPDLGDMMEYNDLATSAVAPSSLDDYVDYSDLNKLNTKAPSPTELFLPDSVIVDEPKPIGNLRRVDSAELLFASLNN